MCTSNTNPAQMLGCVTTLDLSFRSANVAFPLGFPKFSTILCTSGSRSPAATWRPHAVLASIPFFPFFLHFGWSLTAHIARGKLAASTPPRRVVITSLTFYTVFTSWHILTTLFAADFILLMTFSCTQGIVALKTLRQVYLSISLQFR